MRKAPSLRTSVEISQGKPVNVNGGDESMVLTISDDELIRMKMAVTDSDEADALRILKELVRRLEQQKNLGLKSHLD